MPGISQRQLAVRRVDADHGGKPPVLYYAGIRPAEAVALRETDCQLPENGWGRLVLAKTVPVTTKKWTDHGGRHDSRGLKQRGANAVRIVPIPPQSVGILDLTCSNRPRTSAGVRCTGEAILTQPARGAVAGTPPT